MRHCGQEPAPSSFVYLQCLDAGVCPAQSVWRPLAGQPARPPTPPSHPMEPISHPSPSIIAKCRVCGHPDPGKEVLSVPSLLVEGPALAGRAQDQTLRALSQALLSLFSPCTGLAGGPQLCVGSWPSTMTDLLPAEEWTVPTPWKSPAFSWPGWGPRRFSQADRGYRARSPG